MKRLLAVLLLCALPAAALADVKKTGNDWLIMADKEKIRFVTGVIDEFQAMGVPMDKTPEEYAHYMDEFLTDFPDLGGELLGNLFASVVYMTDAEAREAIDELHLEFPGPTDDVENGEPAPASSETTPL